MDDKIIHSLDELEFYIINLNFKGYDPYDGLNSPIFNLPILKTNKLVRFGFQQVFRRIPINFRPLLGIKKGLNPVTLGLSIQAFTYLAQFNKKKERFYLEKINYCLAELISLQSKGYSGSCWGYEFDWEARYVRVNAYTPTIVATGFITNALFEYYKIYKDQRAKNLILSASQFVIKDLNRTYDNNGDFCFSYSPYDKQIVFNATMKGARLLAQCYSINNDTELLIDIKKTIAFVMKYQEANGAWSYSGGDARTWIDNFHSAYVLDCLSEYILLTGDRTFERNLELGKEYYINTFFENNGTPRYFSNKIFPIDSTCAAQSIITLTRLKQDDLAKKVLLYMIENMQSSKGYFYYQKNKYYKNRISYMRWSNVWMYVALATVLK
ncbi:MAG: hypothetical protein RDU14_15330 [Melioribacteraceae bacterium]|nr:hypothetical protein [Melioribacteraceae bacterium]